MTRTIVPLNLPPELSEIPVEFLWRKHTETLRSQFEEAKAKGFGLAVLRWDYCPKCCRNTAMVFELLSVSPKFWGYSCQDPKHPKAAS
jgi:hypothetical protein